MNFLQITGRIGLIFLAILAIVLMVMSFQDSDWGGVFIGIGFFSLILYFGDALRLERINRMHPEVSARPGRKIVLFFFICGGSGLLLSGINRFVDGNWLGAAAHLVLALILLFAVFGSWDRDRRHRL